MSTLVHPVAMPLQDRDIVTMEEINRKSHVSYRMAAALINLWMNASCRTRAPKRPVQKQCLAHVPSAYLLISAAVCRWARRSGSEKRIFSDSVSLINDFRFRRATQLQPTVARPICHRHCRVRDPDYACARLEAILNENCFQRFRLMTIILSNLNRLKKISLVEDSSVNLQLNGY